MDDVEYAIEMYRRKKAEEREKQKPKLPKKPRDETKSRNLHIRLDKRRDADIIKWFEDNRPISPEIRRVIRSLIAKEVNENRKEHA